ncbi:hypothetical protein [Bacillus cereus]|uniref:hypothetical protein n=1 Tax=Bacillus cereus TaxID=1396 RepID=UPI00046F289D|nr:hypothetical protein [Bacillus cereus]MDA2445898.1 hypothetical protein [Bacillus cereus]
MSMNENLEDEHNRMNLSGFQFNGELKFVLLKVADVLIPLQKWINSKPSPNQVPDTEEYLPWRHGKGPTSINLRNCLSPKTIKMSQILINKCKKVNFS